MYMCETSEGSDDFNVCRMPYGLSESNTHQGTGSASVCVCKFSSTMDPLSAFQKNFYGSVSTCGQVRGLHIPQWCSVTHFPHCPPRRPWHHGQTGMHVHVLPPPADSLCPNQMHRNVTRRNNLCRNKSTRIAVLSCYKKTESPENVAFIKNLRKRNWLFKIGTVTPVLIWRITTKSGVETHMRRAILGDPGSFHIE